MPTLIVYGEKDKKIGLNSVGDLRNLADNEIFPMEKAGHSCHYEKPDQFHALLYNFLKLTHHYIWNIRDVQLCQYTVNQLKIGGIRY